MATSGSSDQLTALGDFIRAQRKAAEMSLRELAEKANVSNPYISQIERGLHEPSMRVLRSISSALNLPLDALLVRAGLIDEDPEAAAAAAVTVESAIGADPNLTADQRASLLAVYRSYVAANNRTT
jgi:transcriptional regulator with XRE-family HTH domain